MNRVWVVFIVLCAAFHSVAGRVYIAVDTIADRITIPLDSAARSVTVEARVATDEKMWRIAGDRWSVTVEPKDVYADVPLSEPSMTITVYSDGAVAGRRDFAKGFKPAAGEYNSVAIALGADSTLTVSGGATTMTRLYELKMPFGLLDAECRLESKSDMKIAVALTETVADRAKPLLTGLTPEIIAARLKESTDPVEGEWELLDRENDPVKARPGGRYRLAVLSDGAGEYDIIYLGGAEVNRSAWKPGMLKGHLRPTVFIGQYDLVWVDSMMIPIENDISATVEEALMTLSFPLLKSRMRFSRRPTDK